MNPEYRYRAHPENVLSYDTLDITVDLGFYISRETRLHLSEVEHETSDIEIDTPDSVQDLTRTNFVNEWIATAGNGGEWPLVVEVHKPGEDRFDPYFGIVERVVDGAVLNVDLIEEFGEELHPDEE
jgi:hypothetical protein